MAQAEIVETLDVNATVFYETICDFKAYPSFVTGISESRIQEETPVGGSAFLEVDMIKKISYSINFEKEQEACPQILKWTLAESDFLNTNTGVWKVLDLGDNKTEVSYSLDVEFSISVPGFILKKLIKKSLPQAIKDFYTEAKKRSS